MKKKCKELKRSYECPLLDFVEVNMSDAALQTVSNQRYDNGGNYDDGNGWG